MEKTYAYVFVSSIGKVKTVTEAFFENELIYVKKVKVKA